MTSEAISSRAVPSVEPGGLGGVIGRVKFLLALKGNLSSLSLEKDSRGDAKHPRCHVTDDNSVTLKRAARFTSERLLSATMVSSRRKTFKMVMCSFKATSFQRFKASNLCFEVSRRRH